MKAKKIIVLMLALVLVCAVLVACNENTPQIETPKENDQDQNQSEYPFIEPEYPYPSEEKKPVADPDPNNPYDVNNDPRDYSDEEYKYDGTEMSVTLTNSESLNNLFYDYVLEDFGADKFVSIEEKYRSNTLWLRLQIKEGRSFNPQNIYSINPETFFRTFTIKLKEPGKENVLKYIDEFYQRKDVLYVDPELLGGGEWFDSWFTTPSTDLYSAGQWGLSKIQAYDAWDTTTGSSNISVGNIDSGILRAHPDLTNNVSADGYADTNENAFTDAANHGTITAGIIGAVGNNGKGISGVCWNVNLVSLKANIGSGDEQPQLVINAINYAISHNIKILNFSGGFYESQISVDERALLRSTISEYNGLLVLAAGNGNYNIVGENDSGKKLYPQSFDLDNILVVGASDIEDKKANFSNYSSQTVDLFAPGVSILSTCYDSDEGKYSYDYFSGTSMAAPFVTGVAALILSRYPYLSAKEIKKFIIQNVDTCEALFGKCVSGGRLNAMKAVGNSHTHPYFRSTYYNLGVNSGHIATCKACGFVKSTTHKWTEVKKPNTGIVIGYECMPCGAKAEVVALPNPMSVLAQSVLAQVNEKESVTSGDFGIEINRYVAIVRRNGKYYLMIACDDEGRRLADLSKILKREEKA